MSVNPFFKLLVIFCALLQMGIDAKTTGQRAQLTSCATSLKLRLAKASAGHHYKFFVIHFANAEYGSSFIAYLKLLKAVKVAICDAPCPCGESELRSGPAE